MGRPSIDHGRYDHFLLIDQKTRWARLVERRRATESAIVNARRFSFGFENAFIDELGINVGPFPRFLQRVEFDPFHLMIAQRERGEPHLRGHFLDALLHVSAPAVAPAPF